MTTTLRERTHLLPDAGNRPRRLGGRSRKGFLVVHIVSAGAWFGIDVVMAMLVAVAALTDDLATRAVAYQSLELFVVWPMVAAGLLCLASGIVLGLGTKYGLVRYWWVATKLVLNVVLVTLVLFALRPGVAEAAEQGRQFDAGGALSLAVGDLVFPPAVSSTALLVAIVLSVFKPWGRIVRRR